MEKKIYIEDLVNNISFTDENNIHIDNIEQNKDLDEQLGNLRDILTKDISFTAEMDIEDVSTENDEKISEIKEKMDTTVCIYCGNTGRTEESKDFCPHCGRVFKLASIGKENRIIIPEKYKKELNREFIDNEMEKYIQDKQKAKEVKSKLNTLCEINDRVAIGNMFKSSIYISGDRRILEIIKSYVYSIVKNAEDNGYLCSDIIYLNELDININTSLSLSEITNKDLYIAYVPKIDLKNSVEKLDYILSKRTTLEKPTIVLSAMPLAYIKSIDMYCELTVDTDLSMIILYDDINDKYR